MAAVEGYRLNGGDLDAPGVFACFIHYEVRLGRSSSAR
jgi:hypothetical protein